MASVAPPLEEKIRENGKVDLFCAMTDFDGWSLDGFWAELKFDAKGLSQNKYINISSE